jgi:ankyrin repeat protein
MADQGGRTPCHYSALAGDALLLREQIAEGIPFDAPDKHGFRPLHLAAQQRQLAAAQVLLDAGAEVDSQNAFGNTPLSVAVFNSRGDGDLIRLLRERGADPLVANASGQTPVGLARLIANYPVADFFADLP